MLAFKSASRLKLTVPISTVALMILIGCQPSAQQDDLQNPPHGETAGLAVGNDSNVEQAVDVHEQPHGHGKHDQDEHDDHQLVHKSYDSIHHDHDGHDHHVGHDNHDSHHGHNSHEEHDHESHGHESHGHESHDHESHDHDSHAINRLLLTCNPKMDIGVYYHEDSQPKTAHLLIEGIEYDLTQVVNTTPHQTYATKIGLDDTHGLLWQRTNDGGGSESVGLESGRFEGGKLWSIPLSTFDENIALDYSERKPQGTVYQCQQTP